MSKIVKNKIEDFDRVLEGALNGCDEDLEKLLEMVKPLILSSSSRYYYGELDKNDLVQDGRMMVLESIKDFDQDKGVHFLGYIKSKLKYMYMNMTKEKEYEVSLNTKIDLGEGSVELMDILEDESVDIEVDFIKKAETEKLRKVISELTERELQVVNMYYFKYMDMKKISRDLGLAYRTVVNTKVNAVGKLRKILRASEWQS